MRQSLKEGTNGIHGLQGDETGLENMENGNN